MNHNIPYYTYSREAHYVWHDDRNDTQVVVDAILKSVEDQECSSLNR